MEWKSIFLQSFLTFVAVLVGIRFFSPDNTQQLEALQKSFSDQIQSLDSQKSESASGQQQQTSSAFTVSARSARTADMKEINQSLQTLGQSLEWIMESLERLEDARGARIPPVPPVSTEVPTDQRQSESKGKGAAGWIQDLSEHKRMEVEDIFREQAESLKASFPDGPPRDPKAMIEIMEKNDQELKERLRTVLSEDEYKKFMDSHPEMPKVRSLPKP